LLAAWYTKHLKDWLEAYLAELAKGVIVLAGLAVFRVAILGLQWIGEDQENLTLLLQVHFWLQYATMGALGLYSLFKLIGGMF
jgi:hypothetical protein